MKRIYSILLALCVSNMLSAQLSIWDGTDDVWTKGAGTESSPYLIESAQQLAFIASMVNGGVTTYENTYFKLMTNIDLNNLTWVPIGESSTKCFKGHFDGNNKTIYNSNSALFDYISNGSIERLIIKAQGVVGKNATSSVIKNCSYQGNKEMIYNASGTRIEDCWVYVTISENSISHATLIVNASNCIIKNCISDGAINVVDKRTSVVEYGDYSNYRVAAGLVCVSSNSKYYNCLSRCNVSGKSSSSSYTRIIASGLVGRSTSDSFYYCSNIGNVQGMYHYVDCYERPNYTICSNVTDSCHIGIIGLVPKGESSNIKNSYTTSESLYKIWYYRNTSNTTISSGNSNSSNSYSSAEKTEQAMKSASFPIVLNTDSTVFIKDITPNVNDGYPIYANQVYAVTDALTTIGFTSAQLLGHYYALNADSVGFEYKKKNDNTHWYQSVAGQAAGNIITCDLTELTVGTNYVYRVWVERNGVRYFGEEMSFKTLQCSKIVTPLTATICQGEEYTFNGLQLTQSGAYYDTLVATNGCDSIIKLTLTIMPTAKIDKYDTIMVGDSYDFYGEILTESGNYEHYIPMANKCNLIILHLYVRQPEAIITGNVNDPLMGSIEGAGSFEKYTERTIKAVPNEGYHFVQWDDGVTTNPRTIYLTQDTTFTAQFAINRYAISVTCNSQQGSIEGESGTFNHGTELTYKANANESYHFTQWSDGVKDNPRTIVLTKETTLSAEFALNTYTLSVTCNATQGEINGTSGVFEHGTSHNFEAVPNIGYHFVQWSDEVVDNPRIIILTQDSILSAEFTINIYLVQFFGFNDELLDSQYIEHGTAAVAPETPIVEHYDFVGWDKEFTNVISNLNVFAIYQENTESFENIDVDVFPRKIVLDGQIYIIRGEKVYTITGQEL